MDLTAPLIFALIFLLGSISLFLVYKYGIKKKSFEEVQAEQRKQTSALLGNKPKPKEKKNKKASKKVNKEKTSRNAVPENETPDDTESVDSKAAPESVEPVIPQSKSEVSPENVGTVKPQVQSKIGTSKAKGSNKQSKVHVEFKEEPDEVPAEIASEKEVKEVTNKKRVKKVRPILAKKLSEQEIILPAVESPVTNHFEEIHPRDELERLRGNSKDNIHKAEAPKEDKKPEKQSKKNKQHKQESQQQLEKTGPIVEPVVVEKENPKEEKIVENMVAPLVHEPVVNTGKEKKKKKSEFNSRQQMTAERDQLIHSVHNAELSRKEVQILIDLLLNKQLEAPTVVDDWSEGKSDPVQKLKKQLADKEKQLADEQEAFIGVQAKLKEIRNEQLAERSQLQQKLRAAEESRIETVAAHNRLQQKIQELEEYRSKEMANFQRIVEENNALKMQRGQLEATLMTYQETDAIIHNLKAENAHLNTELQMLTQERQEQAKTYQNCVIQIQSLQEELRGTNEYVKGLHLIVGPKMNQSSQLIAQHEETRNVVEQLQRASENHLQEQQRLKDIIAQLKSEKQQLEEESNIQVNGSSDESKEHEVKILNLSNELSSVKSELTSVFEKLVDAEKQYKTDLSSSQKKYDQLKIELEEQKSKNNELRQKNWKVMEALNAAEGRNKQGINKNNIDQITSEVISKEQKAQKEFIQRLFPEIESLKSVSGADWQDEYEQAIQQYISRLKEKPVASESLDKLADVAKLQSEVQHYKKILDETEGMLKKLETHIEQQERTWWNQLAQKDTEIRELKYHYSSELQAKVSALESQLSEVEAEKVRLLEERQQSINRSEVKTVHSDSTATIEKLSEEVDRLKEQLAIEQTKDKEAVVYQNGETS